MRDNILGRKYNWYRAYGVCGNRFPVATNMEDTIKYCQLVDADVKSLKEIAESKLLTCSLNLVECKRLNKQALHQQRNVVGFVDICYSVCKFHEHHAWCQFKTE